VFNPLNFAKPFTYRLGKEGAANSRHDYLQVGSTCQPFTSAKVNGFAKMREGGKYPIL